MSEMTWAQALNIFLNRAAELNVCCVDQVNLLAQFSHGQMTWQQLMNKLETM